VSIFLPSPDPCERLIMLTSGCQRSDPATGEVLGSIPEMTAADTTEAITRASEAFETFSKTTPQVGVLAESPHGPTHLTDLTHWSHSSAPTSYSDSSTSWLLMPRISPG
jgi:hypothetical protein